MKRSSLGSGLRSWCGDEGPPTPRMTTVDGANAAILVGLAPAEVVAAGAVQAEEGWHGPPVQVGAVHG